MRGDKFVVARRWHRETEGSVMVEFAVASVVFFLLVCGIIDLGHAYFMDQVVTNASREGARYGITYKTDSNGQRISPSSLNPSIQSYVLNEYLNKSLASGSNPQVTVSGDGYTGTCDKGENLEVTVTAVKSWIVINNFIPGLGDQITLSATTVMKCE